MSGLTVLDVRGKFLKKLQTTSEARASLYCGVKVRLFMHIHYVDVIACIHELRGTLGSLAATAHIMFIMQVEHLQVNTDIVTCFVHCTVFLDKVSCKQFDMATSH